MGNAKGRPTARADIEPTRYIAQALDYLYSSPNSYLQLLPRDLVITQLAPYAQDALCGAIILRRADDLPPRFPAPLSFSLIRTTFQDLGPANKVPLFFTGITPYRDSSNTIDQEFVGAVERLLARTPVAQNDTVHALLYLRDPAFLPLGVRLSTVIEKTSSGYIAFTAHGLWVASDRCKAWISWRSFASAELAEPFEEQYYVHHAVLPLYSFNAIPLFFGAESTDIREPVRYLSIQLPNKTRHLLPCHWARSLDIVRQLYTRFKNLQASVMALLREEEMTPGVLPLLSPPKTIRERLLECWPSRQTYVYRMNMLEYQILPLFASIWLQPGIPARVLQKILRVMKLPSDDSVWALFRAKTHDGPLVLTSTCVMWRPKGKEETTQLDLETLAKCDLQERKGKKIVFSHKTLPDGSICFRHLPTEKLGVIYLPSSPFQLLRVLQWVLWEMKPEWAPASMPVLPVDVELPSPERKGSTKKGPPS